MANIPHIALPVIKYYEMVRKYNINVSEICTLANISPSFFYRGWRDPSSLNIATAQRIVNAISHWISWKKNTGKILPSEKE